MDKEKGHGMTQEDSQEPYQCQPSGGMHRIHRMATERPGVILRTVAALRSRSQADKITMVLNTAWAEGRAYEWKHPGQ